MKKVSFLFSGIYRPGHLSTQWGQFWTEKIDFNSFAHIVDLISVPGIENLFCYRYEEKF